MAELCKLRLLLYGSLRFCVLAFCPLSCLPSALLCRFEIDKPVQLNMTTQVVEPSFYFLCLIKHSADEHWKN
jgi:hypothetical protein